MMTALFLCLLFSLLTLPFVNAANANNYFCRGCATVIEHTWQNTLPIIQSFSASKTAGSTANTTFDIQNLVVKKLCTTSSTKFHVKSSLRYTEEIRDTCAQMVNTNPSIVSGSISGTFPELSKLYERTESVCMNQMDLCSAPSMEQLEAFKNVNECEMCQIIVDDMTDTLTRCKGSNMYLTKTHVWGHIDDGCSMIQARYPPSISGALQTACDNLFEDYEEEIADAFTSKVDNPAKIICGKMGKGVCKNMKGNWKINPLLKSPFSLQQSPNYDL